ncbi:MAG TPA: LysR family transcriptional regulator [Aestuariivirga sp.]|nr:LysR family transcriptional regulator [Aestuariivirga sp.]
MRHLDNIDLRLLRIFVVLADAGGFADAQITLNLSQSTLSTHLSQLEKRIGAQLCLRGRRKFQLTDIGQATYDAARKLFADIDSFQSHISTASGGVTGRLKIGLSDGVFASPYLGLQKVIQRLMRPGFDVFVDLFLGIPSELERRLTDGDRNIVIGPLTQKAPGIIYQPFYEEAHFLYCADVHPLFDKPDSAIEKQDIDNSRFAVRSYRHFDDLYRVNHPRAGASVVQMEAQLMLILSGRFIGFLPAHLAEQWEKKKSLRAVKPKTYCFSSLHNIAYRESDADRPLIRAFLENLPDTRLFHKKVS